MDHQLTFEVVHSDRVFVIDCPGLHLACIQNAIIDSDLLAGEKIILSDHMRYQAVVILAEGVTIEQVKKRLFEEITKRVASGQLYIRPGGKVRENPYPL